MRPDGRGGWGQTPPWGEIGLTARVFQIAFLWAMSKAFRHRQFWKQKAAEQKRYSELIDTYDNGDLKAIRNRAMFHLDYEEHQSEPRPTGDIEQLTGHLVAWLLTVVPVHYKDPNIAWRLETASNRGRILARHYRRMMVTYYRAEVGRPTRRRMNESHVEFFSALRQWPTPNEKDI
jgi:hypothetical protein